MKLLISFFFLVFYVFPCFSQDCEVFMASIHGKYTGECKNKKLKVQAKPKASIHMKGILRMDTRLAREHILIKTVIFLPVILKKGF